MKIFIFGSNGMLGNYVQSYLKQNTNYVIKTYNRKDYDISKLNEVTLTNLLYDNGKETGLKKNDIVINCAGTIPQSSKQRELSNNIYFKINSIFPIILGNICEKRNARLIHITTDCVFSGNDGNYDENSEHDEINNYGVSKSLGELCKGTMIRTSIIGEEQYNKRSLLEWVISNKNKTINGFKNHLWNGVTCLELSKILRKMIDRNIYWEGVRHIYSPRSVSKYELVKIINDKYKLNITINEYNTDKKIDKTITTLYKQNALFNISDLNEQIEELLTYNFNNN